MGNRFASGKRAIGICDRCGFQFKLKDLQNEVVKTKQTSSLVCRDCWDPDHPQLQLGMYPVEDPQALRNPRPDNTYRVAGQNLAGYPSPGSRDTQWGWNPVGGAQFNDAFATPNYLVASTAVGTVTVL